MQSVQDETGSESATTELDRSEETKRKKSKFNLKIPKAIKRQTSKLSLLKSKEEGDKTIESIPSSGQPHSPLELPKALEHSPPNETEL